jgi:hypothetical protein
MRKMNGYRPTAGETLENRTVPSGLGGLIGSVPAQDAQLVLKEFATFAQTYAKDVQTILLPKGTTTPLANRAAFDTAVGTALGTLNTSIDSDISNLSTAATLDATIQAELLGSASTTLQSELAAISTPTGTSFRATGMFLGQSGADISKTAFTVANQVRTAPAPAGTISAQTLQTILSSVGQAFGTFNQAYNSAVKTILLPTGTTNPSTNRAAFDTAVGTALTTLNTSVSSALSALPSSVASSLSTTITADLLTSAGGKDLQDRLAALKTPTNAMGFSVLAFRFESAANIGFAQSQVAQQIVTAVQQYNGSL